MNEDYEYYVKKLEGLSELTINYLEPNMSLSINPILFKLSKEDISKTSYIENLDVEYCYEWYYLLKLIEINDIKYKVAKLEYYKSKAKK